MSSPTRRRPVTRRHRPRALTLAAIVAAAATILAPTAAQAGTVAVTVPESNRTGILDPPRATFNAADGEFNRVVVTSTDLSTSISPPKYRWTFKDAGAPLTAAPSCEQIDANTASCTLETAQAPGVALGDGDDELISDKPLSAYGGDGNDTVRLNTGAAASLSFVSGDAGDDLLDASLASSVAMFGGDGNDVLIGSEFIDELQGDAGNDQLRGGGGDDVLSGSAGTDELSCGQGNDAATLDLSDHLLDPAAPIQDSSDPEHAELQTDCETIGLPADGDRRARINLIKHGQRIHGSTLSLGARVSAPRASSIQLRDTAGKLLGTGSLTAKNVKIRLNAAGLAALKPGAHQTVRLLTRPRRAKGGGPKDRPGVQVDLTIGK